MNKLKRAALLGAALAIGAGVLTSTSAPVQAADGDVILSIDFSGTSNTTAVTDAAIDQGQATTDFIQSTQGTTHIIGDHFGENTMYDAGRYIIGTNPHDYHVAWVDQPSTNPRLILNGFPTENQNVFTVRAQGEVCTTPGSSITFEFAAKMANVLPLAFFNDGGAKISVAINNVIIGTETVISNDPANPISITGSAPAAADGSLVISVINNSTVLNGNDFSLDDITVTQRGNCNPPVPVCVPTTKGVWYNYTGNFNKVGLDVNHDGIPDLNDPQWHALPATPGGEHALSLRGFDKPYQPGKDKGKGDWFVWRNGGVICPEAPLPIGGGETK